MNIKQETLNKPERLSEVLALLSEKLNLAADPQTFGAYWNTGHFRLIVGRTDGKIEAVQIWLCLSDPFNAGGFMVKMLHEYYSDPSLKQLMDSHSAIVVEAIGGKLI